MQKILIYKNETIVYECEGNGKSVILIHGFGEDASVWTNTTKLLSKQATVYTLHLPGTGLNLAANAAFATINDCTKILETLYEVENITTAIIIGHSMGGYIALAFAKNNTSLVAALGLVHSSVFADDETKKTARTKNITFIETNGTKAFIKQSTPNLFAPIFVNEHKEWLQTYMKALFTIPPQVLINYTTSMKDRSDCSTWVKNTNLPILYIAGDQDKAIPFEISLQQSYLPKISYFHLLKNVGHMGMFEASRIFNQHIIDFATTV